ncbi:hypothetical protein BPAE_0092g00320 [Botrytis paeoniae]|uniref:Uncharacterized protein n=1 Tax=Botrytis paeoniae TaxID=278948 RepID=A0A4Z1FR84_9HELO|nr:hypothetical protein BPAE_0092g00320 [Botrytis paeoniae]
MLFYRPDGSIRRLRSFERFISIFVIAILIMFYIELSFITAPAGQVFKSLLPYKQYSQVRGGKLMPHTIYLGSGLAQARMREFDHKNEKYHEALAAADLSKNNADADLQGICHFFSEIIVQAAETIFAVGLLFSGVSVGFVATMAGQLICEGAMD